jgi:hypothetical protein
MTERPKPVSIPPASSLTISAPTIGKPVFVPLSPQQAAEFVEQKLRLRFEAGDERALLDAVDICARAGIAMPWWLAAAFSTRYTPWRRLQMKTLDEAFRVAGPKGRRWSDLARREHVKSDVLHRVCALRREGLPLDESLFTTVGRELGISGGLANRIYYDPANREDRDYVATVYGVRAADT